MRVWTYGEVLDIVNLEFDLTNESFIKPDEMVSYVNKAIQKAAADIYKLGVEDEYFQMESYLAMVDGASSIALPAKIYADKIRDIVFNNGVEMYTVRKMRRHKKFFKEAEINKYATDTRYRYRLRNTGTTTGKEIVLIPPSRETSSDHLLCYFIREAEFIPLVTAGSLSASRAAKIDLPECQNFIIAYVKWCVAKKIPHPNLTDYANEMQEERDLMISTLTGQVDDDDTELEPDLTHYRESS